MATLAARIASSMQANELKSDAGRPSAVLVKNCAVFLPHLSYAQWPPHHFVHSELPILTGYNQSHWRGISLDFRHPYKVASWLYLMPELKFRPALQKKIGRAHQCEFHCTIGGNELLDTFWPVYARHIHRLGSLPLPKRFFHAILQGFEEGFAEVILLYHQNRVVGSACNLWIDGFYENAWFATESKAQKLGASYFFHDFMIKRAQSLGAEVYSFGRSTPQSGVHQFKRQWATVDIPLAWYQNGALITKNPYHLRSLGKILKYLPFSVVAILGSWAFRRIY